MIDLNQIPTTYDNAVELLAAWHLDGERKEVTIYLMPDPDRKIVKFVEVSSDFADEPRDVLHAVATGGSRDFPFSTSIVLASRGDWQLVQSGAKRLPDGWAIDQLVELATGE